MAKHPAFETIGAQRDWPAMGGKLSGPQIAQRSTWTQLPDRPRSDLGTMHAVEVIANTRTGTTTILNPLDPGTVDDPSGEQAPGWLFRPGARRIPGARAGRR